MKIFSRIILSLAISLTVMSSILVIASPQIALAEDATTTTNLTTTNTETTTTGDNASTTKSATKDCSGGFLGFPAWYRGLTDEKCNIVSPTGDKGISNFIWHIVLNVLEMGLLAAGYITGFYLIYGGFLFIMSQGHPEDAAEARTTMLNATIGIVISFASVAIVRFLVEGVLK